MLAGPEIIGLIQEFEEAVTGKTPTLQHPHHHEQSRTSADKFLKQVQDLTATIEDMGNPFNCSLRWGPDYPGY